MATPVNSKIIVSVNMKQKDTMKIGNIEVNTGLRFETNYREKSPVIARIEQGNQYLKEGDIIVCHHNHYYPPSPYFLYDCYYSIPANHTIFGILSYYGDLTPAYGNIFGERIDIESIMPLPSEQVKQYKDRIKITKSSNSNYKEDQVVFTRPSAPYDIVYNFGGIIKRVTKVWDQMVCGILK
jgi:hypothetical protein